MILDPRDFDAAEEIQFDPLEDDSDDFWLRAFPWIGRSFTVGCIGMAAALRWLA